MKPIRRSIWFSALLIFSIILFSAAFTGDPTRTEFESITKSAEKSLLQVENSAVSLVDLIPTEPEITYEEVDEVVYTLADADLHLEVNSSNPQQVLAHSTNLHRTGISEDWSRVELSSEVFLCQE